LQNAPCLKWVTFADQAVIAIQNARLFKEAQDSTAEVTEALERQTATSEILRVISQSPTDVQPVFDAIVQTAVRLIRCDIAFVLRCDGATFSPAAAAGPDGPLPDLGPSHLPIDPGANFPSRAIVGKKNVHLPDWSLIDLPEHERQMQALIGVNSALFLPLLREAECIGVLALAGKQANIFGESEIALADSGSAGAADRHRRYPEGYQQLGGGHCAGIRADPGQLRTARGLRHNICRGVARDR
jgi:GAF domain-containing protein